MSKPIPLEYGKVYHVYNRGNNGENLFIEKRNYRYFLRLYTRHVHPVMDTYAYCLLRNHFHLLVRVKTKAEINANQESDTCNSHQQNLHPPTDLPNIKPPSRYFSNFFNAYAKGINKAYGRSGALFERPFRRIKVANKTYFTSLVTYIHHNPEHHNFVDDFRTWPYTSYNALRSTQPTCIQRDIVLGWFNGPEGFMKAQQKPIVLAAPLALEEEIY